MKLIPAPQLIKIKKDPGVKIGTKSPSPIQTRNKIINEQNRKSDTVKICQPNNL